MATYSKANIRKMPFLCENCHRAMYVGRSHWCILVELGRFVYELRVRLASFFYPDYVA